LKDFDQDLYQRNVPKDIICDAWLNELLIDISKDFCIQFNYNVYQDLYSVYRDNPWTNFIWSRIMHLSIIASISGSSNNMLLKLNDWMVDVKHNNFDVKDKLTIILIINLFENIIKYTTSVFSLPNIPYIIDFIYHIKNEEISGANIQEIDVFFSNGQREIKEILLLQGKLNFCEAVFRVGSVESSSRSSFENLAFDRSGS
jgi:hypothetical protein